MDDIREIDRPHGRLIRPLGGLYTLWDQLGEIPIDSDERIEAEFLHFEAGTHREEIWHWFEGQNPQFVVGEVQQGLRCNVVRGPGM